MHHGTLTVALCNSGGTRAQVDSLAGLRSSNAAAELGSPLPNSAATSPASDAGHVGLHTEARRKCARHSSIEKCRPKVLTFDITDDGAKADATRARSRSEHLDAGTVAGADQGEAESPCNASTSSSEEGEGQAMGPGAAAAAAKALARVMRLQSELSRLQHAIQACVCPVLSALLTRRWSPTASLSLQ